MILEYMRDMVSGSLTGDSDGHGEAVANVTAFNGEAVVAVTVGEAADASGGALMLTPATGDSVVSNITTDSIVVVAAAK
jgi:hypothetical protein